jgi:branched-chain amino acid aminotransferase
MVNSNGNIVSEDKANIALTNRAFNYGDALFETMKVVSGKIMFLEDHYFRLMSSMRVLRMEIPMHFTMEYIESEIVKLLEVKNLLDTSSRVKFMVNRKSGGLYAPTTNDIDYLITTKELPNAIYRNDSDPYEIELFKDYYIAPGLLSTIKTNNKIVNVLGSIFAKENGYQNAIILNTNKMVVEALNANLFLVNGNTIRTPSLADGSLKGVLRKQIIDILDKSKDYELIEDSISPFDLLKADEVFLTNVIMGIQSVSKYRKKQFRNDFAMKLLAKLNERIRTN